MNKIVRPRLLPIEIQILSDAVSLLILKTKELLEANPDDSEIIWDLICAQRLRSRLVRLQTGQIGSAPTQVMLAALVPLATKSPTYVRALVAVTMLPTVAYSQADPFARALNILKECAEHGLIRWYNTDESNVNIGMQYARKDVELLAHYLKEFRC